MQRSNILTVVLGASMAVGFTGCASSPSPSQWEEPEQPIRQGDFKPTELAEPPSGQSATSETTSSPSWVSRSGGTTAGGRSGVPGRNGPSSDSPSSGQPRSDGQTSGSPASGQSSTSTPSSGSPSSGQSSPSTPPSESPASGQPSTITPPSESPASGQSSTNTPSSGSPSSSGQSASSSESEGGAQGDQSSSHGGSEGAKSSGGSLSHPDSAKKSGASAGSGGLPADGSTLDALTTPGSAAVSGASGNTDSQAPSAAAIDEGEVGGEGQAAATESGLAGEITSQTAKSGSTADAGWAVRPEGMPVDEVAGDYEEEENAAGFGGGDAGALTGGGPRGTSGGGSDGLGQGEGGIGPRGTIDAVTTPSPQAQPGHDPSLQETHGEAGPDVAGEIDEDAEGPHGQTSARRNPPESDTPSFSQETPPSQKPETPVTDTQQGDRQQNERLSDTTSQHLPQSEVDPRAVLEAFLRGKNSSPGSQSQNTQPTSATPQGAEQWHRQVRGAWELVSIFDETEDFLPSGATRRLIGIDPDARTMEVVLLWEADASIAIAAEYEVGFRPAVVEVLPREGSPMAPAARPLGLAGIEQFKTSPLTTPCELPWRRSDDLLTIGGAVYQAVSPDAMRAALDQPVTSASHHVEQLDDAGRSAEAGTVDFFGIQAQGRYICYVVDVSGSMGPSGGLVRLRAELEHSLRSLPAGTRFAVLPFNHTLRDLQPSWTRASPNKVRQVGARLSAVGAQGGTDPTEAFEWAFRQLDPRPDAIFFMTDGQLNDAEIVMARLDALNATSPRTRIHAIGFGEAADIAFLRQLAAQHGGTVRLVH